MGSIIHHKNNNKQSETYTNSWNSIINRTIPSSRVEQSANLLNPPSFTGVQAAYSTASLRGSLRETSWQESVSGQSLIKPNSGGSIRERFSSFPDLSSNGKRASPLETRLSWRRSCNVNSIERSIRVNLSSQPVIHAFRWSLRCLGDTLYTSILIIYLCDREDFRKNRWGCWSKRYDLEDSE